jgi:hypothetical protein
MLLDDMPIAGDVQAIREVVKESSTIPFVRQRICRNVNNEPRPFSKERFWRAMLDCLLSSCQHVGPNSRVRKFSQLNPYPLTLEKCLAGAPHAFIRNELETFGGVRFYRRTSAFAACNLEWLEAGGWAQVRRHYFMLSQQRSRTPRTLDFRAEREAARFIDKSLKGFGPKQSRNLWQLLGLTRYEIPIDRRVRKWSIEICRYTLKGNSCGGFHHTSLYWIFSRSPASRRERSKSAGPRTTRSRVAASPQPYPRRSAASQRF